MSTQLIPVENVTDNQFNPRSKYDPDKIKELASSIDQNGLLETPKGHKVAEDMYELAYGGYRLRAFKNLAKREIDQLNDGARQYVVDGKLCMPVDVIEISDTAMVIYALEENIKRQNMTPMDQANAIAKYFDLFPGTKEDDLAKKLSMNQATISNMRRVTRLPKEILKYVDSEEINFTQAKELVPLMDIDGITKGNVESRLIMIDAISLLGTEGYAKTVKGIQKAINKAVISVSLSTDPNSPANPPIFDVSECSKCDKTIKTIGDDGKSTPHCFDSECWNIKQKAAQRKKEEDEVVAAEATRIQKEAEDALAKEQAEKEATEAQAKKAENIPQGITVPEPVIIRVAPSRLDNGDIAQLYSAKEIFAGEPIVGAFNIEGENYPFVNVGTWYDLPGDILAKHGYKIIPHEEFTGEIRSLTPPEGVDAAEYRATLKADPMGPYNGVLVHWNEKEYVMVGPVVVFATSPELAAKEAAEAITITESPDIGRPQPETEEPGPEDEEPVEEEPEEESGEEPENKEESEDTHDTASEVENQERQPGTSEEVGTTPVTPAAEPEKSAAVETVKSQELNNPISALTWTCSITASIGSGIVMSKDEAIDEFIRRIKAGLFNHTAFLAVPQDKVK